MTLLFQPLSLLPVNVAFQVTTTAFFFVPLIFPPLAALDLFALLLQALLLQPLTVPPFTLVFSFLPTHSLFAALFFLAAQGGQLSFLLFAALLPLVLLLRSYVRSLFGWSGGLRSLLRRFLIGWSWGLRPLI